jgi:hypothetical protein
MIFMWHLSSCLTGALLYGFMQVASPTCFTASPAGSGTAKLPATQLRVKQLPLKVGPSLLGAAGDIIRKSLRLDASCVVMLPVAVKLTLVCASWSSKLSLSLHLQPATWTWVPPWVHKAWAQAQGVCQAVGAQPTGPWGQQPLQVSGTGC